MIALLVMVRNEERCIERCLASASAFVDRMIVVDTGSSDRSSSIARDIGASVHAYDWIDDFSAARNFSMNLANGYWKLFLDADEWIETGGEALRKFAETHDNAPRVGQVKIRHAFENGDEIQYAPSWTSRLLPPTGVSYRGRIHEQVVHSWPVHRVEVTIGHDGFLPQQRNVKTGRNVTLLQAAIREEPDCAYLHFQLGREWQSLEKYPEAVQSYSDCRKLLGWNQNDDSKPFALIRRFPWLHDLAMRLIFCLKRAGELDALVLLIHREASIWDQSPDYHFAAADALLACATAAPDATSTLFPIMEFHWQKCLEIGETPDLEGHVEGRGSFLAARNLNNFRRLRAEYGI